MIWSEMSYNKFDRRNENDMVLFGDEIEYDVYLFYYGTLENLTMGCCYGIEEVYGGR